MDSRRSKDSIHMTEEMLSRFPQSIEANVSGAYFLIKLKSKKYKEKAIEACIRAMKLVIAEKKNPSIDRSCLETLEDVCDSLERCGSYLGMFSHFHFF